jgi:hypothetical protein
VTARLALRCSTCGVAEAVVMAVTPGSEPVCILGFPIEAGEPERRYCLGCWLSRFGDGQARAAATLERAP